jgi:choline monooxygenase
VLDYRGGEKPPHGAIWLTYYPNIMVEWYPHVLVVSTLHPIGPQKTLNVVEFYYPEEIVAVRARVRRGRAGRLHGDLHRGRRDRRAHGRGRRALMKRATTKSAPTRARWKTACSISTSGTASLIATIDHLAPGRRLFHS